jgi:dTDP-4-amino-4,6-dideoxygalactose transaminase
MSSLSHAVLRAQDFAAIVERRRRNYFHLLGKLRSLSTPVFSELPAGVCPLFYPFQVRDKQTVVQRLVDRGIEAVDFWRVGHPALPQGTYAAVDQLRQTVLEIPCHQDLSPGTIDRIAVAVTEVMEELS